MVQFYNCLAEVLSDDIHRSLYVDDFIICYKSKNINFDERRLQHVFIKFKTGSMRMASNFQKLKLLACFIGY